MSNPSPLHAGDSQAYIDALLAFLGDRDPLEVFAETPDALRAAAEAVPESLRTIPEAPTKWSVLNVVQHFAHAEIALAFRYRAVLAEDAPGLPAIDPDAWIANLYPNDVSLEEALNDFAATRAQNLRLLRRVHGDAWDRYGMHSQRGKETLRTMVRLYAAHDRYHLHQIQRIEKAIR